LSFESDATERERYATLVSTLSELTPMIEGRDVLDFGASYGLSLCALLEIGAKRVTGVETDHQRVKRGISLLEEMGISDHSSLTWLDDTGQLPFADETYDVVIANAVLEHIPQPRDRYVREMWRVLRPKGCLIVNETPNKYLPKDFHTTGLWFVPWMPNEVAREYAVWRRKWSEERDWESSGWRGMGYFELTSGLSHFSDESPQTRLRHRLFKFLGFSPQILDPYPTLVLRKL
jgi:ubiquinone/menaquinone biosynthesis C-methylase UbiE